MQVLSHAEAAARVAEEDRLGPVGEGELPEVPIS